MKKPSNVAGKSKTKKLIATAIATLVVLAVFTSTVFADSYGKYNVTIIDSGVKTTIATTAKEPIDVLKTAGITLASDDKMDITAFAGGEGGTIVINRLNTVNIKFNGKVQTYDVYAPTVGEAIKEIGLTVNDENATNYKFADLIKDGMVIEIKDAPSVTLVSGKNTTKYAKTSGTVKDLVELAGIKLAKYDYTKPALDTQLKADMKVEVFKVVYLKETKNQAIEYKTVEKEDDSLDKGETEVVTEGKNGNKKVTYEVKYVNGKVAKKKVLDSVITSKPTTAVVKVGTKEAEPVEEEQTEEQTTNSEETETTTKVSSTKKTAKKTTSKKKSKKSKKSSKKTSNSDVTPNGVQSYNGISVGQVIDGYYTRYCMCAQCNGVESNYLASGAYVYYNMPDPHYVALNWLPMGSVIKLNGTNYTVVDRGGSGLSSVGRVDVFTPEGHEACFRYGCGSCTLEIVRLGW